MPTIIIDGQFAGTWKRKIKNKGIDIEFNLFRIDILSIDEIIVTKEDRKQRLRLSYFYLGRSTEIRVPSLA
jgi:hypothetical protein